MPHVLASSTSVGRPKASYRIAQSRLVDQYHTRISSQVHDPLTVTALAIETKDEQGVIDQAVWVSCDLVAIRKVTVENARRLVAQSCA